MWRPGKAVVPHRHEEPASYRPTTTARKHGPLQSRTGRQIRDVDRGYTLLWSRLRRHCLILIDARFSSCSPRSSPTETLPAIGVISTSPARLCRPCRLAGPAHPAATAGFSIPQGEIPRETDCLLEGDGFELPVREHRDSRMRTHLVVNHRAAVHVPVLIYRLRPL